MAPLARHVGTTAATRSEAAAFLADCDPVATHPPKFGLCDVFHLLLTFGDGGAK